MIDAYIAIIYGIIQGLTEFFPISSSGHLALLPYFLDKDDPGAVFDLFMHFGTAMAVIVYFRQDLKRMLDGVYSMLIRKESREKYWVFNFGISTFVSVVLILMIKDFALLHGRANHLIAFNLIFFGLLMFIVDRIKPNLFQNNMMENTFRPMTSGMIGFFQVLAIFPGVSRSGITLTAARAMGLSRVEATRYSFLLSLPIIIGGVGIKLPLLLNPEMREFSILPCLIGVLVSFLVGIISIHYFLKMMNHLGLGFFCLYRLILGGLILLVG